MQERQASFHFLLVFVLFLSYSSTGQSRGQRFISDNNKKYYYSDTAGVTQSYISYFGDTFTTPDLETIDGKIINPSALKGKTVFYNFWFVTCRPCVAEIPTLNKLAEKYQSDSTVFIAISFDNATRIKEFIQKRPFNFALASLPQDTVDSIKRISFYPFTAIMNKNGKLVFALFGRPPGKNTDEDLFKLLDDQLQKTISLMPLHPPD